MGVSWDFVSRPAGFACTLWVRGSAGRGNGGGWLRSGPSPLVRSIRRVSIVSMRGQVDEPSGGGPKAAGIEVEPGEMLFEVHVQPLAPGRLGVPGSMADKRRGDPLPLILGGDLGVEEEGVITAVPCHVDKAGQGAVRLTGSDPAKAVGADLIPPSGRSPAAMGGDERHHL